MEYPKITHLYKYYAYNCNSLSVLINKTIWFSKPASLNDPFEFSFESHTRGPEDFDYMIKVMLQKPASDQRKKELSDISVSLKLNPDPHALNEAWVLMCKKFREDLQNWGVFCLSELNDNILMWSHYADHHKGFCVEFSRTPQNGLGDIDKTNPVIYSCAYPAIVPGTFDVLLTKSIEWRHEAEWRLINDMGDVELPLLGDTVLGDITAIIFGLKMPLEHRTTIKTILSNNSKILYKRAVKAPNHFGLEVINCKPDGSLSSDD